MLKKKNQLPSSRFTEGFLHLLNRNWSHPWWQAASRTLTHVTSIESIPISWEGWHNFLSHPHFHFTISPCFLTTVGISNTLLKDKLDRSRFVLIFCKQSFPPTVFAVLLADVISQQAPKCFSSIRRSSVMHRIWGWNTCWNLSYSFTTKNQNKTKQNNNKKPKTHKPTRKNHSAWASTCSALPSATLRQCHSPKVSPDPSGKFGCPNIPLHDSEYFIHIISETLSFNIDLCNLTSVHCKFKTAP